jgi:adenylate kinase family enzyme
VRGVVIIGNSGSGKATLASRLARDFGLAHQDLDALAWLPTDPPERRPVSESARQLLAFIGAHVRWVTEGCYADLAAVAAKHCDTLVFLNPAERTCVEHARARPWEPHKYPTKEAQDANLEMLVAWIRDYYVRHDVMSLEAHRALFDSHAGEKVELTDRAATTAWSP